MQDIIQVQSKMTASAGKKAFKNLKLENYRYDISLAYKTCLLSVRS